MKRSFLLTIVVGVIFFALGMFWQREIASESASISKPPAINLVDLRLNQSLTVSTNTSKQEANGAEETIKTFENYKYQKDFVGAINMLTTPQTTEEKGWLDHLLGNDLTSLNNNKPSPRFFDKVNFHILAGYETESITKKSDIYYVNVKEIRFINSIKEDGDTPNYVLQTQDLTFEIVNNGGVFQISKYYHTKPTSLISLKYEGFVSY